MESPSLISINIPAQFSFYYPPPVIYMIRPNCSKSSTRIHCHKMYVPGEYCQNYIPNLGISPTCWLYVEGFGEASPEAKAANHLHHFFTYIAIKIVAAQLQSYNPEAHADLMKFLENHSISDDGDKFCANLMRESPQHKALALRILEVRSAYCKADFEWDNLKRLSLKMVEDHNTRLMRDYVSEISHES